MVFWICFGLNPLHPSPCRALCLFLLLLLVLLLLLLFHAHHCCKTPGTNAFLDRQSATPAPAILATNGVVGYAYGRA